MASVSNHFYMNYKVSVPKEETVEWLSVDHNYIDYWFGNYFKYESGVNGLMSRVGTTAEQIADRYMDTLINEQKNRTYKAFSTVDGSELTQKEMDGFLEALEDPTSGLFQAISAALNKNSSSYDNFIGAARWTEISGDAALSSFNAKIEQFRKELEEAFTKTLDTLTGEKGLFEKYKQVIIQQMLSETNTKSTSSSLFGERVISNMKNSSRNGDLVQFKGISDAANINSDIQRNIENITRIFIALENSTSTFTKKGVAASGETSKENMMYWLANKIGGSMASLKGAAKEVALTVLGEQAMEEGIDAVFSGVDTTVASCDSISILDSKRVGDQKHDNGRTYKSDVNYKVQKGNIIFDLGFSVKQLKVDPNTNRLINPVHLASGLKGGTFYQFLQRLSSMSGTPMLTYYNIAGGHPGIAPNLKADGERSGSYNWSAEELGETWTSVVNAAVAVGLVEIISGFFGDKDKTDNPTYLNINNQFIPITKLLSNFKTSLKTVGTKDLDIKLSKIKNRDNIRRRNVWIENKGAHTGRKRAYQMAYRDMDLAKKRSTAAYGSINSLFTSATLSVSMKNMTNYMIGAIG